MDLDYLQSVLKENVERCSDILFDIESQPTLFDPKSGAVAGVKAVIENMRGSLNGLIAHFSTHT